MSKTGTIQLVNGDETSAKKLIGRMLDEKTVLTTNVFCPFNSQGKNIFVCVEIETEEGLFSVTIGTVVDNVCKVAIEDIREY